MPKLASGRYSARARIAQNPTQNSTATDAIVRTGAVLAATTALVSAMAATASAAPVTHAAPAAKSVAKTVPAAAPAVTAPKAAGPVVAKFGTIGVKAVAKPKPKPKPVVVPVVAPRTQTAASRSTTTRSTLPATSGNSGGSATNNTPPPTHNPPPPVSGGVLAIAASLSGIPYVYGGSTPAGFDCSGFTMYIFAKVGISLPRTAAGQQAAVTRVSSPQPGDLVFFGYPAYHVGIYAGNGMMYDSPRTGLSSGLRAIWSSSVTYGRP